MFYCIENKGDGYYTLSAYCFVNKLSCKNSRFLIYLTQIENNRILCNPFEIITITFFYLRSVDLLKYF